MPRVDGLGVTKPLTIDGVSVAATGGTAVVGQAGGLPGQEHRKDGGRRENFEEIKKPQPALML